MSRHRTEYISLRIERKSLSMVGGGSVVRECPQCSGVLELSQPDVQEPLRMLGTCEACGTWCLIDLSADGTSVDLLALPGHRQRQGAILATFWPEAIDDDAESSGA